MELDDDLDVTGGLYPQLRTSTVIPDMPWSVEVPRGRMKEAKAWCRENVGTFSRDWRWSATNWAPPYFIHFREKHDAAIFALTWSEIE